MQVPVPTHITDQISQRAVQLARENVKGRGWSNRAITAINTHSADGLIGLSTSVKYLMYQDRGIKPFIMYWVEGRKVPIKGADGSTHVVRGREPGRPGYVYIPGRGRVWRDQKWRHPGLQPKNFLEDAIDQAIKEYRPAIKDMLMTALRPKT